MQQEYAPKSKTVFPQEAQTAENVYPSKYRKEQDYGKEIQEDEGVQQNRKAFGMVNDIRLTKFEASN